MTEVVPDHPDVLVFPPVIPIFTLLISGLLQWLTPIGWIADLDPGVRVAIGAMVVLCGLITTSAGRRALVREGTNVNPLQPTTALVTNGIFRRTRNPLYVGILVALFGIALLFALDWLVLLIIPSCLLLHFGVVMREERYLERKFGDAYRRYKESVPRYLSVG
jgi:protein-S-isoprenylcysteine O-methyltransferase Ste14